MEKTLEYAIVSYGGTARTAYEAMLEARKKGYKVGMVRLITIWPFADKVIADLADKVDAILVPELNYGQLVHEVQRASEGKCKVEFLGKYDTQIKLMTGYTFKGKQKLCYTEVSDFTDFQGVGHDPLYKRFDSVMSVVKKVVAPEYQHFLATPQYVEEEDQICWHIDEWKEHPHKIADLTGEERAKYESIKEKTIKAYRKAAQNCDGEDLMIIAGAIRYLHDDSIYCCDGKVFVIAWGMTPDTHQHKIIGSVIHEFDMVRKYKITFDANIHGVLVDKLDKSMTRPEGFILSERDLPKVSANEGWLFKGWMPSPIGVTVNSDLNFVATYEEIVKTIVDESPTASIEEPITPDECEQPQKEESKFYACNFVAGEHGKTEGVECEPYITADYRLMMEHADEILVGLADGLIENVQIQGVLVGSIVNQILHTEEPGIVDRVVLGDTTIVLYVQAPVFHAAVLAYSNGLKIGSLTAATMLLP